VYDIQVLLTTYDVYALITTEEDYDEDKNILVTVNYKTQYPKLFE
jgi:hypothetical protein